MTYRAAILGCGSIARAHASGYAWAGIPVEAAADIVPENVNRLAEAFQIPGQFDDFRRLLEEVRPDIVSICTWPPLHEEMALAAVEAGARAIMCEKPLAVSLAAADRMMEACRARGVLLVIGHQRRYEEPWRTAREWIAAGEIGEPRRVLVCQGGDLQSDVVHGLDLALFLLGDPAPEWVLGQIDRERSGDGPPSAGAGGLPGAKVETGGWRYGHPVEHSAVLDAGLDTGARITVESGKIKSGAGYIELTVIGSEGMLRINSEGALYAVGERGCKSRKDEPFQTRSSYGQAFRDVAGVLSGSVAEHPLDARHHRKSLEIVMAAFESSRRRGLVRLPLPAGESALAQMVEAGEV